MCCGRPTAEAKDKSWVRSAFAEDFQQARSCHRRLRLPSTHAVMQMQRRLASTVARTAKHVAHVPPPTLAVSHLPEFPPRTANANAFFDANAWGALQPPPPSALHAFAHRVGLGPVLGPRPDDVLAAVTHESFGPLWQAAKPSLRPGEPPRTNANLAALGNSLLGMFAAEWLHASFPHLPTRVLKAAVSAYVGPLTCAAVAKEMGVVPLLRWNRTVCSPHS
jgi:large subunit ribosomal protein L44